jgi:hypothetical protein
MSSLFIEKCYSTFSSSILLALHVFCFLFFFFFIKKQVDVNVPQTKMLRECYLKMLSNIFLVIYVANIQTNHPRDILFTRIYLSFFSN